MRTIRGVLPFALVAALAACDAGSDEQEELPAREAGEPTEPYAFQEWDANADRALTREEFGTAAGERLDLARYEANQAEGYDRAEATRMTYELWDVDDDDALTENEWEEGITRWYGSEGDFVTWSDWDGDGDSELDFDEMTEGYETHGLFDRLDLDDDTFIDDEELQDWFFDVFDLDDDERVDVTEWDWGESYDYVRM